MWKVIYFNKPVYIRAKLRLSNTRSGRNGGLAIPLTQSALGRKSFMVRGVSSWNSIPVEIRGIRTLESFKFKLKKWIKENVEID